MSSPRRATRRMASGAASTPAATSAAYSPTEWPATNAGCSSTPARADAARSAARQARDVVTRHGCVCWVWFRRSSGPSQATSLTFQPSARSASSKARAASGHRPARSRPMPTAWEPCGEKRRARLTRPASSSISSCPYSTASPASMTRLRTRAAARRADVMSDAEHLDVAQRISLVDRQAGPQPIGVGEEADRRGGDAMGGLGGCRRRGYRLRARARRAGASRAGGDDPRAARRRPVRRRG